jgi:hypothetical protein
MLMNKRSVVPGKRVRVSEGSGLASGAIGTIIPAHQIPVNVRGIPALPGYYQPVDWKVEIAIRYDNGALGTMFKNRLVVIPDGGG